MMTSTMTTSSLSADIKDELDQVIAPSEKIINISDIDSPSTTHSFHELHEYQMECIRFMITHPIALLILEMGLGKTIITLSAIRYLKNKGIIHRVLVIAPLRVCQKVWPEEVKDWDHTKDLQISVIVGAPKARAEAIEADADIYVVNRENTDWLVSYMEKNHGGEVWPFDMVAIDELSSFKNVKSKCWRALRRVRPFIKRMVGLTGTPASNGLEDLFGEVGILDGGQRLGKFLTRFHNTYFKPSQYNPFTGQIYKYELLPGADDRIYSAIDDISISMKALDYLDMPELLTVDHIVEMSKAEYQKYEELKGNLCLTLGREVIDAKNAAVLSGKLRQMASGTIYDDMHRGITIHRRKLEALEDLVEQANGQTVLIVYWFQSDHDNIHASLEKAGYDVRDLKTSEDLDDWEKGKISVGLISPASAGHGLNLQHQSHLMIWYSLPWSLELYQQTVARLWRQGQKQKVIMHRILCKDTIDEKVAKALTDKATTQDGLINAVKAEFTHVRNRLKQEGKL